MGIETTGSAAPAEVAVAGALELGGGHVTGALIDTGSLRIVDGSRQRRPIDSDTSGDSVIVALAAVGARIAAQTVDIGPNGVGTWGLAVPGPFDYDRGVAWFDGVGKFASLYGVDVRATLAERLGVPADRVRFTNDADAFLLGALSGGSIAGHSRCMALTLGTGVGCSFAVDGRLVPEAENVIPGGRPHVLFYGGRPLEDVVSTRAIVAAYRAATGRSVDGVKEVAERARRDESAARSALDDAMVSLGRTMRPFLESFGATAVVVGGSISRSWDVIEPSLRRGLGYEEAPPLLVYEPDTEGCALAGAVAGAFASEEGGA
ncbi:ROK family protein [Phytoactinopolyspora halotolerans]|uniref:ROK family protein n=1 Tax=Phytoactinopolyspora halotolerans TaxID=1981512 RepID=A0A6L9SIP7_9ACTN|nr:ROK family protein [Phytoactinopolyspora halotolerans]NEE04201.1 ROK family protein [Phytoactinopolyspora halotolerans]